MKLSKSHNNTVSFIFHGKVFQLNMTSLWTAWLSVYGEKDEGQKHCFI